MSDTTDKPVANAATTQRRDPFARLRMLDVQWVLLKPQFRNRQLTQPERLARVTTSHERVGTLELYRLEVQLEGEPRPEAGNLLEVLVDHRNRRVRFGPADGVAMTPAGRGLAGYLLSQLIEWLQVQCPHYLVTPLPLDDRALSEPARQARDRLLQRAGFDLHYADPASGLGRAQVSDVSGLIAGWNTERVQVCSMGELLAELRDKESQMLGQQGQLNSLRATLDSYQRTDVGHRFAIGCLLIFSLFQALLLFWVVLR